MTLFILLQIHVCSSWICFYPYFTAIMSRRDLGLFCEGFHFSIISFWRGWNVMIPENLIQRWRCTWTVPRCLNRTLARLLEQWHWRFVCWFALLAPAWIRRKRTLTFLMKPLILWRLVPPPLSWLLRPPNEMLCQQNVKWLFYNLFGLAHMLFWASAVFINEFLWG